MKGVCVVPNVSRISQHGPTLALTRSKPPMPMAAKRPMRGGPPRRRRGGKAYGAMCTSHPRAQTCSGRLIRVVGGSVAAAGVV